jgi:hypothetical protein
MKDRDETKEPEREGKRGETFVYLLGLSKTPEERLLTDEDVGELSWIAVELQS